MKIRDFTRRPLVLLMSVLGIQFATFSLASFYFSQVKVKVYISKGFSELSIYISSEDGSNT